MLELFDAFVHCGLLLYRVILIYSRLSTHTHKHIQRKTRKINKNRHEEFPFAIQIGLSKLINVNDKRNLINDDE